MFDLVLSNISCKQIGGFIPLPLPTILSAICPRSANWY